MHFLFCGNWEKFTSKRFNKFGTQVREGIAGSNVIMQRSALEKLGNWDPRIQSADFDLFIKAKIRYQEAGDIKPVGLLLGMYFHHYIRLTSKSSYPPFKDLDNIITIKEKWGTDINPLLEESGMTIH